MTLTPTHAELSTLLRQYLRQGDIKQIRNALIERRAKEEHAASRQGRKPDFIPTSHNTISKVIKGLARNRFVLEEATRLAEQNRTYEQDLILKLTS